MKVPADEYVTVVAVGVGVGAPPALLHASTSAIRATPSTAAFTIILIFEVVTAENLIGFHTRLLLRIDPPGTVANALPFQYCTSKDVMP